MKRRIVILADRQLGPVTAKMANGAIRYMSKEVVAIVDSKNAGKKISEVIGFGGDIPIYESIEESMQQNPNTLLIGISPPGGRFPSDWYPLIISAIQNKLNIISGLHEFLIDIAEFRVLAEKYHVKIVDLRKYDPPAILARGIARNFRSKIVLTIGTHGNVGKMTTTIEMVNQLQQKGKSADWLATGQIGILLKGKGIPIDAVKGDFISGNIESAIFNIDGNFEYIFLEGQGSLHHLGFSPVALGILHGSLPDAMILCHRTDIGTTEYGVNTENLNAMIKINEEMLSFVKPAKVVGISLNTYHLTQEKASNIIEKVQRNTGLPTTDPLRFETTILTDALVNYFKMYKKQS